MNTIQSFNFGQTGQNIRVYGSSDSPHFVAADVCAVLDIKNISDALSRLDDDEKGIALIDTLGGVQEMLTVNESGLYSLIFSSRKAEARPFRKWVTSEVLPSIRKTGSFSIGGIYTSPFKDIPREYQGPISPERKKGLKPFKEKTEISEQQLKVYCFVKGCDRWLTNSEIAEGAGIAQTSIRSFVLYFSKAGIFEFMETHPKHLYRFSDKAEARHPGLYARMENAVRLLGDPLLRRLPQV
jgi:prophage antirepressor-like protein